MEPMGAHPHPSHVIAHLSDPHLLAGGALQFGAIDTTAHLQRALTRLAQLELPPQALVFTGDLADLGEPAAYAALRELVEPVAASLGAEIIWCIGNHDERETYSAGLFGEESGAPQDRVHDIGGLRIVALDSTVPGWHHGALDPEQLDWLREVLATQAEHGTILAMHHPPIPVPMVPEAELIALKDQQALAAVVRGTDVRAVLGGHFHYTSFSTFAGVPVSVASATCYTLDPAPDARISSSVDGAQAFTMLHVYEDRVVHTVVPAESSPEVFGFPREARELLLALSPQERFEMIARKDSPLNTGELQL
jgi:Icc protein